VLFFCLSFAISLVPALLLQTIDVRRTTGWPDGGGHELHDSTTLETQYHARKQRIEDDGIAIARRHAATRMQQPTRSRGAVGVTQPAHPVVGVVAVGGGAGGHELVVVFPQAPFRDDDTLGGVPEAVVDDGHLGPGAATLAEETDHTVPLVGVDLPGHDAAERRRRHLSLANSVLTFGASVSFAVAALSVSVVSFFGVAGTDIVALFSPSTITSAGAAVSADLGGQLVVV